MSRRRNAIRFRLAASLTALAAFLLLAEGGSRLLEPVVPEWQGRDPGDVIMIGHPTRLWGMGSGARRNAGTTANINDLGLRGPKPELPRPKGRARILVTGDSSFFGHGVSDEEAPSALLGVALRAAGVDVDTVNGAIPGYSTEQTRILLDEVGWSLEPTLLVVCNIWSDYNFDHFRDADLLRTRREFAGALGASAFYRLAVDLVERARGGDADHVVGWNRHSRFPEKGTRRVPPRRYAENLDAIIRDAAARGIGVVLLSPTNRDMARGDLSGAEVRAPYFDAQEAVAAWHGLPVVHTLGPLQAAATAQGAAELYLDDLHPSAAGNAVIAGAIAETLLAAGWPGTRLLGRAEPFDASGVVDTAPGSLGASPGPMSPQVNLFPGGAEAAGATNAPPPAPQGAGAGAAQVPAPPGPAPAGGAEAVAAWTLTGTVEAPPGPVQLYVRAVEDDAPLGEAVLRGSPSFSVPVAAGHARVRVEAIAASGRVQAEWAHDGGALGLVIAP